MVATIVRRLDLRFDDAVFGCDEAGDDAVLAGAAAGVEEAEVVVVDVDAAVVADDGDAGVCVMSSD